MTLLTIIDYNIGNVKSIINSLEKVGANVLLTRDEDVILNSDGVILPGVGAFSHGMKKLKEYDRAIECYKSSLATRIEIEDKSGIALLNHNIAVIYKEIYDYPSAKIIH